MQNQVAKSGQTGLKAISPEQIKTLADAGIIPANTPPAQIEVFAHTCGKLGLDPFTKEVHLVAYKNYRTGEYTYSTIVGIHGLEKKAAESGVFAGVDAPVFNYRSDGSSQTMAELSTQKQLPISCRVTVYKIVAGLRVPFTAEALWSEYGNEKNPNWASRPFHMLGKVAKAHALRMAFPNETKGLHIDEEAVAFEQSNAADIEITVAPKGAAHAQVLNTVDRKVIANISNRITEIIITALDVDDRIRQLNALYKNRSIVPADASKDAEVIQMFKLAKAKLTSELAARQQAETEAIIEDAQTDEDDAE